MNEVGCLPFQGGWFAKLLGLRFSAAHTAPYSSSPDPEQQQITRELGGLLI